MASSYGAAEAAYLHLSGPGVWPNETAWHPVDRFITGARPEIRYRMAVDKGAQILEGRVPAYLRARLYSATKRGTPEQRRIHLGTIDHVILEDERDDVRSFLEELRSFLVRKMSPSPQFGFFVIIEFGLPRDPRKTNNNRLTIVSQEWR